MLRTRWHCRCGHPYESHTLYTTSERCGETSCPCQDYRRLLRHWIMDVLSH